jgi:hypothetical protein
MSRRDYPKSHKAAPPTPTHNEMRTLLEWAMPPDGCLALSFINVGGLVAIEGSYVGLPVGGVVLGDEVGCKRKQSQMRDNRKSAKEIIR